MPSKRALLSALLLALTWAMLLPSPSRHKRHASKARRDRLNSGTLKSSSFATTVNATYESACPVASRGIATVMPHHCV